jgi:hypothetical protein
MCVCEREREREREERERERESKITENKNNRLPNSGIALPILGRDCVAHWFIYKKSVDEGKYSTLLDLGLKPLSPTQEMDRILDD